MLKSVIVRDAGKLTDDDVVIIARFRGSKSTPVGLDRAARLFLKESLSGKRFAGKLGDTLLAASGSRHVLLVGLGERNSCTGEEIAAAASAASRAISKRGFKSAVVVFDRATYGTDAASFARAFVKGFDSALYTYSLGQAGARPSISRLAFAYDGEKRTLSGAVRSARVLCEHITAVRNMVNTPANLMTPATMADEARALCKASGVECHILARNDIEKLGMGATLAVSKGSKEDPKVIVMHHNKKRKDLPTVCLVGKGVTFDSGGISIKSWHGMNEMKGDMAGGAVVISTIAAAARQDLPLSIVGVVPCVENMPSGTAFRPGDVITTYSGKTIEILTTDAEGRLILADALAYAREQFSPDVMVDYATLTGAVVIALGDRIAGVMGNSQDHIDLMLESGTQSGEPAWQLPLDSYFYDSVKGDISDFKNYSGRGGSTSTAAALLGKFAEKTNWLHVDIAGTFWSDGSRVAFPQKGATGYGVDLTLTFLEKLAETR